MSHKGSVGFGNGWTISTPTQSFYNQHDSRSIMIVISIFPPVFPKNKKQKVQFIFIKFPLFF